MRVLGYGSRRPTRVPLLTPRHRTIRRAFATNHHGWTLQQWRNVIWSDESRYQLFHADGRHRVWRTPHEAMDPACQVGTVQAGGLSVMVWGAFSWHGMGPLVVLDATLTGQRYLQLLGDHLHPFVMFQHPDDIAVYQDDNAAPHRANIVRAWFDEHAGEIQRLNWPPRSPDMNPIEHIWDALDVRLRALNPQPTNRPQLATALQDVWCQLSPDVSQGLAVSLHSAGPEGARPDIRWVSHEFCSVSVHDQSHSSESTLSSEFALLSYLAYHNSFLQFPITHPDFCLPFVSERSISVVGL